MIRPTGAGQEHWCAVAWVVRAWCLEPNGDPSLDHCKRRSNCPARTPDLAPLILKFCFPRRQEVLRHDGIYMCIGTSHSYGMEHLQLTTGFWLIPMMLRVEFIHSSPGVQQLCFITGFYCCWFGVVHFGDMDYHGYYLLMLLIVGYVCEPRSLKSHFFVCLKNCLIHLLD